MDSIRKAYLDWLRTQEGTSPRTKMSAWLGRQPEMHARRAPGNTCLSALHAGAGGTIATPINDSKGCGGVMRVAPIGLRVDLTPEKAFRLAADAAALTHGHPSGYLSAGAMASIIRYLVEGSDMVAAVKETCATLSGYAGHHETLDAIESAMKLAGGPLDHLAAIEKLGAGWVGQEALPLLRCLRTEFR